MVRLVVVFRFGVRTRFAVRRARHILRCADTIAKVRSVDDLGKTHFRDRLSWCGGLGDKTGLAKTEYRRLVGVFRSGAASSDGRAATGGAGFFGGVVWAVPEDGADNFS